MSSQSSVENRTLPNGKENPKYVDLLDEDPAIAGQKFVCLSFISPESILKKRETYLFEKFIQQWDLAKSMSKFQDFVNFISYKYTLDSVKLIEDYNEFIKEEEINLKQDSQLVENDYRTFMDKNADRLNLEFNRKHDFQTSVRGLKIRGVFSNQEEAEMHSKKTRERDPNHDIYVGTVGSWLPFEPDAYKTGKIDFMEPELNRLHQEKTANEIKAKEAFDQRVKDAKRKAIEENVRKARESGNKLTQTLDDQGNLVGVNTMNFDDREVADDKAKDEYNKSVFDNANKFDKLD
jgi:exoribonuclease R